MTKNFNLNFNECEQTSVFEKKCICRKQQINKDQEIEIKRVKLSERKCASKGP